ncbi:hypothetical protein EDB81DRAFT_666008 [Dactylonectria macrodidyma]|uniref:FAD/NAD(P)-binding domain-containing protein n=1 Tax=Dactylonectria macrodidyma TaxID=307937 RepID=A0A9P9DJ28_9HYPO|nr:hypothetical protein EDB81DRAFT_666008 [Dactylonectria macrodidyma]
MKRVIIIGAGPCGLVALKEMRQAGLDAMIFEKSSSFGGVFASASAYPNLHLTISNWAMAFSDFPDPTRLHYPSANEYLYYLQSYAKHFDLESHINYNSEVIYSSLNQPGTWSIQVRQPARSFEVTADALIIATGASQYPKPVPAEFANFTGRILHSSEYNEELKREVAERKSRVLVVGGGESAADISADLGAISPNVSVWMRRPNCIGPRYLNKDNENAQIIANKAQDFPANGFLEAVTTSRLSSGLNVFAYGLFRRILWHTPVLNRTLSRLCLESTAKAPFRNDQATYVTKNQRMCEAWHDGEIEVFTTPYLTTNHRTCEFSMAEGRKKQREFDIVILCTGFSIDFPWLKIPQQIRFSLNPRSWYLHCFPKDLGSQLFFLGFARPHQGGIPVLAEMLSRYIALILRGERSLPFDYSQRAHRDAELEQAYYFLSPNLPTLVDYNAFMESVARRIGCEPRLPIPCILAFNSHMLSVGLLAWTCLSSCSSPISTLSALTLWSCSMVFALVLRDGLLFKWWFYPSWAVWYRQRGMKADQASFHNVLRRVEPCKSTAITQGFILHILWSFPMLYIQWLLSAVLFVTNVTSRALHIPMVAEWGYSLRPRLFVLHDCPWTLSDLFLP